MGRAFTKAEVADRLAYIAEARASCMTDAEIAQKLGVIPSAISKFAKKHGVRKPAKSPSLKLKRSATPTYNSWKMAKRRCRDLKNERFRDYGGRGIQFCDRWNDFETFLSDMGERPEGTTLDRINTNGNYEPGNCRWASSKLQARNRKNNHCVEFQGRLVTLAEVAERTGCSAGALRARLLGGRSVEEATTTPFVKRHRTRQRA